MRSMRAHCASVTGITESRAMRTSAKSLKAGSALISASVTGRGRRLTGAMSTAASDAYPDPKDATKKACVVDVAPVKKLARPVTLAEIKADRAFASFPLVRMSRLSVMPVTDEEWARIEKMSGA